MLFNSFDFLLFFIPVLLLQWLLPHKPRNLFLLTASYFFYACWDWRFLSLILLSTVVDFYCGQAIADSSDNRRRKLLVSISVVVNLTILGFFKYFNFFIDSAHEALASLGFSPATWHLDIILPVGISFYTFQTLSYSIDVYRGEVKPARKIADFALFVAFFPQLVAGPIERAKNLLPQMLKKPVFSLDQFYEGCWLVFWGLFKKVVIADNLAVIVDRAFNDPSLTNGELLIALYAFAFQIYCDFSGYTDIARGIAKMMGYELMLNFRLPYFAKNSSEFWHRWHISLSTWLRDYLYIPLGGSRKGRRRTCINLMLTMLLGGLWHGAAWTYIFWGGYHGMLLVLHKQVSCVRWPVSATALLGERGWTALRIVLFFHLICLGWLIFRSDSMSQLVQMLMLFGEPLQFTDRSMTWLWQLCILLAPLLLVQLLQAMSGNMNIIMGLSPVSRVAAYSVLSLMLVGLGSFGDKPFIYFQF
ncbi:MAG: membrane-bound O-acyltransferase family protein [Zetaproteobacteria bacterium CG12_big_fil_rev_8_21_14_0_65_54_13]|nr:MAG: membrane-bound O-acyltransferase family protein [Zetaproteobacteria bacterium CG12_big_fil_rev_8_21_14_0_65_54_13]PIX55764.1 MAG: membrane-bound O-acyltransferase family protein [Zetaproteobacteria bacterium CG_4_10_14_3_um_filter_54_28]PJA26781.1 MAG: membrane-bound O-acyltransferase family protein [Zetaproteobacteria bacterium CG_4_9_14_3_um_filter_54_145]